MIDRAEGYNSERAFWNRFGFQLNLPKNTVIPKSRFSERLQIYTLGGLTLWLKGAPDDDGNVEVRQLHFDARTTDALLVYLACQARPLPRETLAEFLWPERSQGQALTNLRGCIHRLRQQLAPYLAITRQTIALEIGAPIQVDCVELASHLAAGSLADAVALYKGVFLDGFYLDDSPGFEQWALLERERLHTLALAAWQQFIGQAASAGERDVAISGAQRLLQLDPLHEPTHRQLMRLLAQSGQRSAALLQFESCRQLLGTELDVVPDESTTALYEQIRAGAIDEVKPAPVELTVIPSPHHNLPPQPTSFIGRDAEVAQIKSLLSNPDCRLLTLLGVGGIGKSRLAIHAVLKILDSATVSPDNSISQIENPKLADGAYFVSLAPLATAELVLMAIAQSLSIQTTSSDLLTVLTAYLRPRALLLILDNFEHLLPAANHVAHLLQHAPHLKVLVTSRERLYLREEWLFPISGLSLAEGVLGEAGQLFLRSAQRVQPGFTGRKEEEAIVAVCRQVEGMPLALELAASWVRVMSCADIASQITHNPAILTTSLRNLPERHRSLRNLFDQSWRLLSALEQGVLRRVSIFAGGWTLDEAGTVAGATLTLLLGLVDKSLVRVSGQNRFDLHELVRQYAAEQLAASGEAGLIRQHHNLAYLQLFRTGDSQLRGNKMVTWLARLEAEQDNLRAALQWTLDTERYTDMAWLLVAASEFWTHSGHRYETIRWISRLLPHRQVLTVELRLAILCEFVISGRDLKEFPSPDFFRSEIIELLELCPYKQLHTVGWLVLALSAADVAERAACLAKSLLLARAPSQAPVLGAEFCNFAEDDFQRAVIQWVNGSNLFERGDIEQATALVTDSLQSFRQQGNQPFIADCLGALGLQALQSGDMLAAHTYFQEIVTIGKSNKLPLTLSEWQPFLGLVTLYRGNAIEARQLLEESLRVSLDVRNTFNLARVSLYLSEMALWEGEVEHAAHWLGQSLDYQPAPPFITSDELQRLFVAARLATLQQQYRRAAILLGAAESAHQQLHYIYAGPMLPLVNAARTKVREALSVEVFDEAFAAGQQLPLNELYTTLLAPAHSRAKVTVPTSS